MAQTKKFTVDNVGNPEPITVVGACRKVIVREGPAAGTAGYNATTEYLVHAPNIGSDGVQKSIGESAFFSKPFKSFLPGETIGYLETIAGSVTFLQFEDIE